MLVAPALPLPFLRTSVPSIRERMIEMLTEPSR